VAINKLFGKADLMAERNAEKLAEKHKEISVSEFFEKNRHLLGYDNKIKALLIIVKEGVDNALDAAEESRIMPEIFVKVEELEKEKYKIVIKDNGPGIVKANIPKIFGTLLYGSKFHRLRQSRGQQGLGISCAVMYSQLTTGEATEIVSSTGDGKTHKYKMKIDVKNNRPEILSDEIIDMEKWHGTQITLICEGIYREHKQSILEYLKQTAISNPFARITFDSPNGKFDFNAGVDHLPKEPSEIKPHLYGIEVGILTRMLKATKARTIQSFLTSEFSRVGSTSANEIITKAGIVGDDGKPDARVSPKRLSDEQMVSIVKAVKEVKLSRPPTDCLSPLGQEAVEKGMTKELSPEFITAVSRSPAVYRGWPFQIEVGLAYGGSIQGAKFMRFANRVPLLYQQGDCAMTKSMAGIDWKRYGLQGDKLPEGPIAVFIHIASVWVPFTSESKEAVASYPIILKEVKLALQEATRKLSMYLSGMRKAQYQQERMKIFERYAGETATALAELTGRDVDEIQVMINEIAKNVHEEALKAENGKVQEEEAPPAEIEGGEEDDGESEEEN
jgi:DNA topoisomerase-6 subunit B